MATSTGVSALLKPERQTTVVDIGANPIDGDPPYKSMLLAGLCEVVGFEPQAVAYQRLQAMKGPHEVYFPYAVGDGATHRLYLCKSPGMSSMLKPSLRHLSLFRGFEAFGQVVGEVDLETRRLDDLDAIQTMDMLKIDVQGSELMIFQGGRTKLAQSVVVQTEISFVPLYENQPSFGEVDAELRSLGFVPHALATTKLWPLSPLVVDGDERRPLRQLLEADMVYVRDFAYPERMTDEQLKHLALLAHHIYGSFDLALAVIRSLRDRGALPPDTLEAYVGLL